MLLAICMLFIVFTVLIKETEERGMNSPGLTWNRASIFHRSGKPQYLHINLFCRQITT